MSNDREFVQALLASQRTDEPVAPSDAVGDALRAGRRHIRRRNTATAAAAGVIAVLSAAGLSMVGGDHDEPRTPVLADARAQAKALQASLKAAAQPFSEKATLRDANVSFSSARASNGRPQTVRVEVVWKDSAGTAELVAVRAAVASGAQRSACRSPSPRITGCDRTNVTDGSTVLLFTRTEGRRLNRSALRIFADGSSIQVEQLAGEVISKAGVGGPSAAPPAPSRATLPLSDRELVQVVRLLTRTRP